jgi:hypothetical protein
MSGLWVWFGGPLIVCRPVAVRVLSLCRLGSVRLTFAGWLLHDDVFGWSSIGV